MKLGGQNYNMGLETSSRFELLSSPSPHVGKKNMLILKVRGQRENYKLASLDKLATCRVIVLTFKEYSCFQKGVQQNEQFPHTSKLLSRFCVKYTCTTFGRNENVAIVECYWNAIYIRVITIVNLFQVQEC